MADIKWLKFSDAESDAIALLALKAARACIKGPKAYDGDRELAARDILAAFAAAHDVIMDAVREADQSAPAYTFYQSPYIEVHHVVATAVHFSDPALDLDGVHPQSIAGDLIMAYALACKALDAYNEMELAVSEGSMEGEEHAADVLAATHVKQSDQSESP